jgi:hypothetical protein
MFNNWRVYTADNNLLSSTLTEKQAAKWVDTLEEARYAVDPNGNTYPPDLHDDGDYDPAFN